MKWAWLSLFGWLTVALNCQFAASFDTGYHSDLTRAALQEHGLGETAIRVAQVENWLVDYYSNSPTAPAAVKEELVKLHFDNLYSTKEVTWYWGWLGNNTLEAARNAALQEDQHRLISILAISLHAVQDFYSHSNWADTHPRTGAGYRSESFLSGGPPPNNELITGFYDSFPTTPPVGHPNHGGYSDGLNNDSQVRPKWDEAYVFAFCASWEWIARIKAEVEAARPGFWQQACNYALSNADEAKLRRDEQAAHKISLWIKGGSQDGHWKGNRSGYVPYFAEFALNWASEADSLFVTQIKVNRIQDLLTPKLYQGGAPPATPPVPKYNLARRAIAVRVTEIKEKRDTSLLEPNIDVGNDADFYAVVNIGGLRFVERVIQNQRVFSEPWWIMHFVDASAATVATRIDVIDEDGVAAGDDDTCDVNPAAGTKHVQFNVQVSDANLSGDVNGVHDSAATAASLSGKKPDKDRAVISFFVQSRPVGP